MEARLFKREDRERKKDGETEEREKEKEKERRGDRQGTDKVLTHKFTVITFYNYDLFHIKQS